MIDKTIEELKQIKQTLEELQEQYNYAVEQLVIYEKALELACERVKYFEEMQDKEMGFFELFGYDSNYDLQAIIKEYKEQAQKELEK